MHLRFYWLINSITWNIVNRIHGLWGNSTCMRIIFQTLEKQTGSNESPDVWVYPSIDTESQHPKFSYCALVNFYSNICVDVHSVPSVFDFPTFCIENWTKLFFMFFTCSLRWQGKLLFRQKIAKATPNRIKLTG